MHASTTMLTTLAARVGAIPDPLPAVVFILTHILANPPDLSSIPVSQPVAQRLQWIKPSPEDESYLYFNNMEGHGLYSPLEQLRIKLAHLGPSSWAVCSSSDVSYRAGPAVDGNPASLPEVFARVTVTESGSAPPTAEESEEGRALGIVMLLEPAGDSDGKEEELQWKYFDLQDPVKPGLDRRPWHPSLSSALASLPSPCSTLQEDGGDGQDISVQPATSEEFWSGYSSKPSSPTPPPSNLKAHPSSLNLASSSSKPTSSPSLSTSTSATTTSPGPRMRRLASSTISSQPPPPRNPPLPASAPPDLELGPSTMTSQSPDRHPPNSSSPSTAKDLAATGTKSAGLDLAALLEAAGIVNLPTTLSSAASRALTSSSAALNEGRVLLDGERAEREVEWLKGRLEENFPKAPGRLFGESSHEEGAAGEDSSDEDAERSTAKGKDKDGNEESEDSQDRENAAVRFASEYGTSASPHPYPNGTFHSRSPAGLNAADASDIEESQGGEEAALEAALKGVWRMWLASQPPPSPQRKSRLDPREHKTTRAKAGEKFVALAHRVVLDS